MSSLELKYLVWCGDDWNTYNNIKIGGKAVWEIV